MGLGYVPEADNIKAFFDKKSDKYQKLSAEIQMPKPDQRTTLLDKINEEAPENENLLKGDFNSLETNIEAGIMAMKTKNIDQF